MRSLRLVPALLLVLLPVTASAAWIPFASGHFDVGSPVAANAVDACVARSWGMDTQEGFDSNCFDVPREHRGRKFSLAIRSDGAFLGHSLCWFTADWSYSTCTDGTQGTVPSWAAHASIAATGGTDIRWTLYGMG